MNIFFKDDEFLFFFLVYQRADILCLSTNNIIWWCNIC